MATHPPADASRLTPPLPVKGQSGTWLDTSKVSQNPLNLVSSVPCELLTAEGCHATTLSIRCLPSPVCSTIVCSGLVETSHKVEVIVWRREFCPRLLELRSALCIQFFTTPPSTFSVGHRKDQTECHSTLHSTTWTPRENGSS